MASTYPLHITDIPYSIESRLNTLDICLPRPLDESPKVAYWVVYIHGGAWRDPLITASSFRPTIDHLFKTNSPALTQIAGFVSINYRLSPYPNHPTHPTRLDPKSTEARLEGRSVVHPAHVEDVIEALDWLYEVYDVAHPSRQDCTRPYVLVGHSCGATLAIQALSDLREADGFQPAGIAGIAGIYDLYVFAQNHADVPAYGEILANAFSGGIYDGVRRRWKEASPVHAIKEPLRLFDAEDRAKQWDLHRMVLAQSRADELVEWEQTELMEEAAKRLFPTHVLEIGGHHDQCWQDGEGVAQTIEALMAGLPMDQTSLRGKS